MREKHVNTKLGFEKKQQKACEYQAWAAAAESSREQQSTAENSSREQQTLLLFAAFCCDLLIFATVCRCLLLFAAVCCYLLAFLAICFGALPLASVLISKWCQNRPQRPQNSPKMDPKSPQNSTLERPGAPRGPQIPIFHFWIGFWRQFGAPMVPKIDQKSQVFPEKWVARAILWRVFCPSSLLVFFHPFWLNFWNARTLKIIVFPL